MRPVLWILATCLSVPAFAQTVEPGRPVAERSKSAPAAENVDKPAAPQRVIEISRSSKTNCDVKPVMTDEEIARCRKAWSR